jgi:hypothetical protein
MKANWRTDAIILGVLGIISYLAVAHISAGWSDQDWAIAPVILGGSIVLSVGAFPVTGIIIAIPVLLVRDYYNKAHPDEPAYARRQMFRVGMVTYWAWLAFIYESTSHTRPW